MAENFTLVIKSDNDGVHYSIESDTPVLTRDLVGVLEMCKLMAFENKIPRETKQEQSDTLSTPQQDKRKMIESVRKICLADEGLSNRAVNGLEHKGIITLEDLLRYTSKTLLRIRHLGKKTVKEIEQFVRQKYKYELGTLAPIWFNWDSSWDCAARLSDMTKSQRFDNEDEMEKWIAKENSLIIQREEGLL